MSLDSDPKHTGLMSGSAKSISGSCDKERQRFSSSIDSFALHWAQLNAIKELKGGKQYPEGQGRRSRSASRELEAKQ